MKLKIYNAPVNGCQGNEWETCINHLTVVSLVSIDLYRLSAVLGLVLVDHTAKIENFRYTKMHTCTR